MRKVDTVGVMSIATSESNRSRPSIDMTRTALAFARKVASLLPDDFSASPLLNARAIDLMVTHNDEAPITVAGLAMALKSASDRSKARLNGHEMQAVFVINLARELFGVATEDFVDTLVVVDYLLELVSEAAELGWTQQILASLIRDSQDGCIAALLDMVAAGADADDALLELLGH
jgi:hypothetical protein